MITADPRRILALIAVAMCWALAVLLFRVGNPGSTARKLALLLVVEGVTLGSSSSVDFLLQSPGEFWGNHPELAIVLMLLHTLGDCGMLILYPSYLAAALQTPLTRASLDKRIRIAIAGISIALFFLVLLGPLQIGGTLLYLALSLLFGFALVASVQAWHKARGATRTRAAVFSIAFGFPDICWGFLYGIAVWELWSGTCTYVADPVPVRYLIYSLGTLFSVPMIAYGILHTQLFDIDLKIRWTIKQSTVASIFIAVMFMVSEGASQFLSDDLGKVTGLLAAGVLMFFLAPLQCIADRVASTAMPNTTNTPEYEAFRKMRVYESALAEAQHEGGISDRERALLVRLGDSLGISETDAESIEHNLQMGQDSGLT